MRDNAERFRTMSPEDKERVRDNVSAFGLPPPQPDREASLLEVRP